MLDGGRASEVETSMFDGGRLSDDARISEGGTGRERQVLRFGGSWIWQDGRSQTCLFISWSWRHWLVIVVILDIGDILLPTIGRRNVEREQYTRFDVGTFQRLHALENVRVIGQ
jgi:hypothetical protein